jgi:hypothetical protein
MSFNTMRCPNCSTVVPHNAAYCPTCGRPAPTPPVPTMAANAHPSKAPIPRSGKLLILFTFLALVLLVIGLTSDNIRLLIAGGTILGLILLVAIIGDHVL